MGTVVTLSDIERVFEILAEFGLSREAVVIPLKLAQPAACRYGRTTGWRSSSTAICRSKTGWRSCASAWVRLLAVPPVRG